MGSCREPGLNLSGEFGFQTDWKTAYQRDTEFWTEYTHCTDVISQGLVRTVSNLCAKFHLSPSVEFSTIDTLQLLLVRAFQRWTKQVPLTKESFERSKRSFVEKLPQYKLAVLSVVAKYLDAKAKLDRAVLKRLTARLNTSEKQLLQIEFEVLKLLDGEVRSSMLLGAVERFSQDYLMPLNVASKEAIGRIGVKLVRVVYAERLTIYDSLKPFMKDALAYQRFKANQLILGAAVVITILHLLPRGQNRTLLERIVHPLSKDCYVQANNLMFLRDAILDLLK